MRNGISVYAGLGYGIGENISLIENAASLGLSRLFTSAQIPESAADGEKFLDEFAMILAAGIENNFEIIIDVNPENIFNFDLDGLTLRLDDGFDAEKVIELSNARKIQLNASTVTKEFLSRHYIIFTLTRTRDWIHIFSAIKIKFFMTSEFLQGHSCRV